jgi:hypothetical protein
MRNQKVTVMYLSLLALLCVILFFSCAQKPAEVQFVYKELDEGHGKNLVADIDNDGVNDIITIGYGEESLVLNKSNKQGGFEKHVLLKNAKFKGDRVEVADIDSDGDLDFVAGSGEENSDLYLNWIRNPLPSGNPLDAAAWEVVLISHHGQKTRELEPTSYVKDIVTVDFNNDGKLDIGTRANVMTRVFLQISPDEWAEPVKLPHDDHEGMDAGDMDKDGDPDLVLNGFWFETPDDPANDEFIRHDIDKKWFTQTEDTWRDDNASVKVADMNGDGLLDLLISQSEKPGFPISIYSVASVEQVKTGPWTETKVIDVFDFCQTLDAGDIDSDGDLDIIAAQFERDHGGERWRNYPPFPVSVFYNVNGDGSVWKEQKLSELGMYAGTLGDVGSDGDLDIVGPRSYWTGPTDFYENMLVK